MCVKIITDSIPYDNYVYRFRIASISAYVLPLVSGIQKTVNRAPIRVAKWEETKVFELPFVWAIERERGIYIQQRRTPIRACRTLQRPIRRISPWWRPAPMTCRSISCIQCLVPANWMWIRSLEKACNWFHFTCSGITSEMTTGMRGIRPMAAKNIIPEKLAIATQEYIDTSTPIEFK